MISTVLLILIVTLLVSLRSDKHMALQMNSKAEIEYVAEAGIADVALQLSKANDWTGTISEVLPDGAGRYTVVIQGPGGSGVDPNHSVNNLSGASRVPGPRGDTGDDMVPRFTADIVVLVEANGREERYEVLMTRGYSEPVSVPLLTSGDIEITGNLNVQGIPTTANPDGTPSGIHSNKQQNQTDIITWVGQGGTDPGADIATINGAVSVASSNPGAISTTGDFTSTSVNTSGGSKQFPIVDVDLAVLAARNVPNLVVNTGGTTVVSGGDKKYPGGTITGDLELNGVNLYVDGDLTVNGTIRGTGAIYVNGNTSFKGSATLSGTDSDILALFSKGHVSLTGFRGSQYLEDLALDGSHPAFTDLYNDATTAYDDLMAILKVPDLYWDPANPTPTPPPTPPLPLTIADRWGNFPGSRVDELRVALGGDDPLAPPGSPSDSLGQMAAYLQANFPGSESAKFMVGQLQDAREFYQNSTDSSIPPGDIIANFLANSNNKLGALDAINDNWNPTAAGRSENSMADLSFEQIGKSYFRGVVYTTGAVYAGNELEIVGALLAEKRGSSPGAPLTVTRHDGSTQTVQAGSVLLEGDTTLYYHEELMQDPFAGTNFGPIVVSAWLGN